MKIHEYQAKEIFKKYGIAVPKGKAVFSAEEARSAFESLGVPAAMVKAQMLAGGRGKSGGIQKASSAQEAEDAARALVGKSLKTYQTGSKAITIRAVLIEERSEFSKELYLAITIDRSKGLPVLIFSEAGGMDIEEVAKTQPTKVIRIPFDPAEDLSAAKFSPLLKLSPDLEAKRAALTETASRLARLFVETDASLAEINPLVVTRTGVLALDAKLVFDDNALFRHADFEVLRDPDEDDAKEKRAKKSGLSYISLEGNIGCLVNGAGLAMATMDIIKQAGGEPANFLDVGGGATKDQVLEAFKIILEDPNVKAVFVNIFGGIMKCDIIAQALLDAATEIGIQVPIIVRLEGTRVKEGRELLKTAKIAIHSASTMEEASKLAVQLAAKSAPARAGAR